MAGWSAGPPGTPPAAHPGYPAGSPYGPYGPPGKGQRETGALLICVAVLVITIVVAFIAAVTIVDDADSSASPTQAGPSAPAGVAGTNGADSAGNAAPGGGAAAGGGAPASSTAPSGAAIVRNFPLYPGARRVSSGGPYLPPGAYVSSTAKYYVVFKGPDSVYRWYNKHLAGDHLQFVGSPSRVYDQQSGHTVGYYTVVNSPTQPSVNGNFNIERGRSGNRTVSVLAVTLYG